MHEATVPTGYRTSTTVACHQTHPFFSVNRGISVLGVVIRIAESHLIFKFWRYLYRLRKRFKELRTAPKFSWVHTTTK